MIEEAWSQTVDFGANVAKVWSTSWNKCTTACMRIYQPLIARTLLCLRLKMGSLNWVCEGYEMDRAIFQMKVTKKALSFLPYIDLFDRCSW